MNLAKTLEYLFSLRFTEDVIPLDLPKQGKFIEGDVTCKMSIAVYY